MSAELWATIGKIVEIIGINVLLSGDNAVVIALACRGLPPAQRRWGVAAGATAAIGLRLVFTVFIVALLRIPFVPLVGGVLLIVIAIGLVRQESHAADVAPAGTLWAAIRTIALADAVMSLDNVIAIAAAARGEPVLIGFGLALSIPLIVFGSTLVLKALERFPVLVWAGAALLGWVAGDMIGADRHAAQLLGVYERAAGPAGALVVLAAATVLNRRRARGA